jgi:hypothetical protein
MLYRSLKEEETDRRVRDTERCYSTGFEKEPGAWECWQHLEAQNGNEDDSSLEFPKEIQLCCHLNFILVSFLFRL